MALNDDYLPFNDFFEYLSFILCARYYLSKVEYFEDGQTETTKELQYMYDLIGPQAFLHNPHLFWDLIDEGHDLDEEIVHYLIQELYQCNIIQCQMRWLMENFEERVANSGVLEDTMLSATEVCSFLNVTKPTLYKLIYNSWITCAYKVGRDWRFKLSELWKDLENMQNVAKEQIEEANELSNKFIG